MKAFVSPALRHYLNTPEGQQDLTQLQHTGTGKKLSFLPVRTSKK